MERFGYLPCSSSIQSKVKMSQPAQGEPSRKMRKEESKKRKRSGLESGKEELKWRPIKVSGIAGVDAGGGMMMLEELDDVEVEWEEGEQGRRMAKLVVRFYILRCSSSRRSWVDNERDELI